MKDSQPKAFMTSWVACALDCRIRTDPLTDMVAFMGYIALRVLPYCKVFSEASGDSTAPSSVTGQAALHFPIIIAHPH